MKNTFLKLAFLFCTVLTMFACNKEEEDPTVPDTDTSAATDNAEAESTFDDMSRMGEEVLTKNNVRGRITDNIACADVTVDTSGAIKLITIVFNGACNNYDGKARTGSIQIKIKGSRFNEPGAVTVIKPVNYTVNGSKVEGMQVFKCVAKGVHSMYVSDSTSNDSVGTGFAKITFADGKITQWKSAKQRICDSNCGDLVFGNNVFKFQAIPGSGTEVASGVTKKNISYTTNIESPVYIDFNCYAQGFRYPSKGIISITPSGKAKRTIDYGDGKCDKSIKVTIADKSFDVNLE